MAISDKPGLQKPPASFRRLVARKTGPRFRDVAEVETVPLSEPGHEEVLIRITYAGVNGGCETFRARGEFAFARNKSAKSFLLGAEGAGIVAAIGSGVTNIEVGQHVTCAGANAFAEYVIAKAGSCYPVKEASAQAVAVSLSGLTAAGALEVQGNMKAGDTVLVTAAAGATGHFAVQLAKLAGCHVIATIGSKAKADVVRDLGADRVINYHHENVSEVLAAEYQQAIDIAYEGVGGDLRNAVVDNLAPGGRLLAVGYISGYPHNNKEVTAGSAVDPGRLSSRLPPGHELMWQAQTLELDGRTIFGNVWPKDQKRLQAAKDNLFEHFYSGRIKALVDQAREFHGVESVNDAMDHMLSGKAIGKVVVEMHSSS